MIEWWPTLYNYHLLQNFKFYACWTAYWQHEQKMSKRDWNDPRMVLKWAFFVPISVGNHWDLATRTKTEINEPCIALKWAMNGLEMILERAWNGPWMGLKWSLNGLEMILEWAWNGPWMGLKWSLKGIEMVLEWAWNDPWKGLKWAFFCPDLSWWPVKPRD